MARTLIRFIFVIILTSGLTACNQEPELTPEEAQEIAKEAYIYGFPMVMGYKAMYAYVLDKTNPEYKGPFNFLACEARLLTPDDKAVVTPNSDTPYCMMWGDVRNEPLVISVPEMEPERFYHFQLVDMYTHNFAYIGTLTTGNGAGQYLVTGPGWSGERPPGINEVIYCETPLFFVIVRTQLFGPGDIENVKVIQEAYDVQPLSEYLGGEPVPRPESIDIPEWNEGDQFTAAMFTYMDAMLEMVEVVPEEEGMMQRFAKLDIGKGKTFDLNNFDEDIQSAINEGVEEGFREMESFKKTLNKDPIASARIFGTRDYLKKEAEENFGMEDYYLLRATAAHMGLYGNSGKEAVYPVYLFDAGGNPLDAAVNRYTITFEPGQLPPVKAFWSLTMYDARTQLMVHNSLNRYLLNSGMIEEFVYGDDGSLTFYIQKESPGEDLESNWLPAPDGTFYAVMRLYGPKKEVLSGEWVNPPIMKAAD